MSDDELLDELERERGFAARLGYLIFAQPMEKAAARIREQRDLLDECERAMREVERLVLGANHSQTRYAYFIAILAKLRAQEQADE